MCGAMMLNDYLAGRGSAARLAGALKIPPELVSQWRTRARPVPLERCPDIERVTGGAVRRWDLRPEDWHRIWPELVGQEGAPDIPSTAAA
jgi:DNA-binding transcriptional regulator YdaS (Cro superfamily)